MSHQREWCHTEYSHWCNAGRMPEIIRVKRKIGLWFCLFASAKAKISTTGPDWLLSIRKLTIRLDSHPMSRAAKTKAAFSFLFKQTPGNGKSLATNLLTIRSPGAVMLYVGTLVILSDQPKFTARDLRWMFFCVCFFFLFSGTQIYIARLLNYTNVREPTQTTNRNTTDVKFAPAPHLHSIYNLWQPISSATANQHWACDNFRHTDTKLLWRERRTNYWWRSWLVIRGCINRDKK